MKDIGNLWRPDAWTQIPHDVEWSVIYHAKSFCEARIIILVSRLSFGCHTSRTIWALTYSNIAGWLRCNPSTVMRAARRLESAGLLYRVHDEGDAYFYSLRCPDAKDGSADAKTP